MGPHDFFTDAGTLAYPYPGRSTNVNALFISKKLMSWVRPGVRLVFTSRFRFRIVLIKEDFPTLDRPAKAISGNIAGGYCEGLAALVTNSADLMIIYRFLNI
jgi:hypothetical protein